MLSDSQKNIKINFFMKHRKLLIIAANWFGSVTTFKATSETRKRRKTK